jgi:hypothetical protein
MENSKKVSKKVIVKKEETKKVIIKKEETKKEETKLNDGFTIILKRVGDTETRIMVESEKVESILQDKRFRRA